MPLPSVDDLADQVTDVVDFFRSIFHVPSYSDVGFKSRLESLFGSSLNDKVGRAVLLQIDIAT